ncbi:ribosome silencing factor [Athalassotoga saccharophila]|uniref:ribosome silencing factor n=1 Tax=Athalassotoga saccharophila TaxID=1441386 RepID=UPI0013796065|nr:ribosome silencing factor [Athalassotoga saccharophila]BBJ28504.1 ribosomal silencing factor RsfS [Athalassotoga saccharophila]
MSLLREICDEILKEEDPDLVILKMKGLSYLTDYFVIATANSSVNMRSIRDRVLQILKSHNHEIIFYDKSDDHNWMIVDAGEIVVNIFTKAAREFYDIESLWSDTERLDVKEV